MQYSDACLFKAATVSALYHNELNIAVIIATIAVPSTTAGPIHHQGCCPDREAISDLVIGGLISHKCLDAQACPQKGNHVSYDCQPHYTVCGHKDPCKSTQNCNHAFRTVMCTQLSKFFDRFC